MDRDDDDDDKQGSAVGLAALEERRKEILARLRVTTSALRDAGAVTNGYDAAFFLAPAPPDYAPHVVHERFFRRHTAALDDALWRKLSAQRFAFDAPDRTRLEWRVNDLGREKCRALWSFSTWTATGLWRHADFVEYMTAIDERVGERQEMHAIGDHEEVWRMYMHDAFAMDGDGLTFDGFLRYREAIEDARPLLYDLQAMGISLECRAVEKMRRVLQIVGEYFERDDVLAFKYVQFLLGECGTVAAYQELWQTIQRQRLFHRCHRYMLAQKRALRLFGYKQKTAIQLTTPALEEDSRKWRSFFLNARLQSYAMLGRMKRRVASFFSWTRKAARTGLLRASSLQSTPERELGDYVFKVEVGSNFSTHSTINATYYSDADSAATLHELKYLERGAECFFFIDLLCRPGTREADALALSQKLTWFIELFFKDHLELLPFFFKWFVTIPSKMQLRATGGGAPTSAAGAAPVIRFVVLFTGEMDLYAVMQSLQLPSSMQFDHLLQRLSMRWMFSHSIEEVLTNKRFVAGSQWCCRGQLDARFNRQAWGQILRQCATRMGDEIALEQEEQEFMASQREMHQQNEKTPKATKTGDQSREPQCVNQQDGGDRDRANQWIEWLHRVAIFADSAKELSLTWSFRDPRSLLEQNAWVRTVLASSTFQRFQDLLATAGAFANEWKSLGDSFRAEFAGSSFVESTLAASAATALPVASSTGTRRGSNRSSGDDMFGSLSSERTPAKQTSVAAAFPFATPVSTPAVGARLAAPATASVVEENGTEESPAKPKNEDPLEYDLLELYEMCVKTLQSVHSMRAEAGTSGLSVTLEGWNVFSVLPRVVPSSVGRRPGVMRTRSTASNGSDSGLSSASATTAATPMPSTSASTASTAGSIRR